MLQTDSLSYLSSCREKFGLIFLDVYKRQVLRKAVHAHLKHSRYVKSFRLGTFGEGEDGVTIVEF